MSLNAFDYRIDEDIEVACRLLGWTEAELAKNAEVTPQSLINWKRSPSSARAGSLSKLYNTIFEAGVRLNRIKEQLAFEEHMQKGSKILFHGAKSAIEGNLSLAKSRANNDFGRGFYCGETFEQSAMFISGYPESCVYIMEANLKGLKGISFNVDREWMLSIAYFRNRLGSLQDRAKLLPSVQSVFAADYIVAPIADNRMYQIIDDFINGEITDVQCEHCLSATSLGKQYIFRTEKALRSLSIVERCFLPSVEKEHYLASRLDENRIGMDKSKVARRMYRNQGSYLDEILGDVE